MKLSIIIPVYNEEKTIGRILEIIRKLKLPAKLGKEIIVVDDGSVDSTAEIVKQKKDFKYIRHSLNLGKGAAVRTGLENASGDLFIIQDADLEYNPEDFPNLLTPILRKETQVVYGTRLTNYPLKFWGDKKTILPLHLVANRFLTALTNILYGSNLTDMETGYKVFTKKALEGIKLKSNKFDIEAEITAKFLKKRIKIKEVPITTSPRTYQEGKKIGTADGFWAIWTLIKCRMTN